MRPPASAETAPPSAPNTNVHWNVPEYVPLHFADGGGTYGMMVGFAVRPLSSGAIEPGGLEDAPESSPAGELTCPEAESRPPSPPSLAPAPKRSVDGEVPHPVGPMLESNRATAKIRERWTWSVPGIVPASREYRSVEHVFMPWALGTLPRSVTEPKRTISRRRVRPKRSPRRNQTSRKSHCSGASGCSC